MVRSLTLSLVAMGNLTVVVFLVLLVFAILGVQLFAGRFWACNDASVAGIHECTGARSPYNWVDCPCGCWVA